ncbi:hypothetical protein [Pseudomonas moorei]|uniref:hypothetical protein n=1 Tax=Pseudomonas moorei TaxID=395599 RepID=UPI0011137AB8|nr:hypothetical protein [Pseudomonas moorei]KAB0494971.1 hypothetical protein F7R06_28595 [Pseudomonas moorei]
MADLENSLQLLCSERVQRCQVEMRAHQYWLDILTPVRWLMVGGSTLLSALAGATVLSKPELFGAHWDVVGGVLALVSSALMGLHSVFKCDAHQSECHRLIQGFTSLELAYQAASKKSGSELNSTFKKLEEKFQGLIEKSNVSPPGWCRKKAER